MFFWETIPSPVSEEIYCECLSSETLNVRGVAGKMADHSEDSDEDITSKIKRLEKEKIRLEHEKKKKDKQRYKELSNSVNSLRSSGNISSGYGSSSTLSPNSDLMNLGRNSDIANFVADSNKRLTQVLQAGSSGRTEGGGRRPNPQQDETSEEDDHDDDDDNKDKNLDKVMSAEHKQKLQEHRGTLVSSMIAEDIFNDLIATKVISTADVSRIKEKNTPEAINEELLNNIIRRSDRAFYEFVRSLRKTLQPYLADLLEPPPKPPKKRTPKRKRRTGEVNVSLDCEEVLPLPKRKPPLCSCQEVEEQVLTMAKTAYHAIRRRDSTPASFEQFKKELQQTNVIVKDTLEIMHTLKILCKHGDEITDINYGSVVFTIRFHSPENLKYLWSFYRSGELLELLHKGFVNESLLMHCQARDVRFRVRIAEEEYCQCLRELEVESCLSAVPGGQYLGHTLPQHPFSQGSQDLPTVEEGAGWSYFPLIPEPRRAFKEIQKNLAASMGGKRKAKHRHRYPLNNSSHEENVFCPYQTNPSSRCHHFKNSSLSHRSSSTSLVSSPSSSSSSIAHRLRSSSFALQ